MKFKRKAKTHRKRHVTKRRRRNPAAAVSLMGNPRHRYRRAARRKVRRHYRRNPSMFKSKAGILNTVMQGVAVAAGAGVTIIITNAIDKLMSTKGKAPDTATKNFISLGVGVGLSFLAPKLKLGKYAETAVIGAIGISMLNILSTSFGLSKYFTLAGESNPELDNIIANLNVSGYLDSPSERTLLGMNEELLGMAELAGMAESMAGFDDDDTF